VVGRVLWEGLGSSGLWRQGGVGKGEVVGRVILEVLGSSGPWKQGGIGCREP